MADFNFPTSPIPNQEHIEGGITYVWNGYGWAIKTIPSAGGSDGAGIAQGLAYSGMQVNGSMEVNQLLGGSVAPPGRSIDNWAMWSIGAQIVSSQQSNIAPPGYQASLKVANTTPNAAPAAADVVILDHLIEGYRVARLGWGTASAQPLTVGFWANATRTGLFSGAARNAAADRACTFSYLINAADTWEFKVVTIPGDTAGVWLKNNGIGLDLSFAAMAGTSVMAEPGVWQAGSFVAAVGQVNCVEAISDIFMITGVVVLPGIVVPTAEQAPLIMRPYPQELETCKRHWRKLARINIAGNAAAGVGETTYVPLAPAMLKPPVVTFANNAETNSSPMAATEVYSDSVLFQTVPVAAGGFFAIADAYLDSRL